MSDRRLKTKLYQKQCFFVAVAGGLLTNCADSKASGKSQHLQVAMFPWSLHKRASINISIKSERNIFLSPHGDQVSHEKNIVPTQILTLLNSP